MAGCFKVTISDDFPETLKKTFGDRNQYEVKEISDNFKRFDLSNNFFFDRGTADSAFNYTIQAYVQQIGANCSSSIVRLLPTGRSPVHRLPFAMLPWATNTVVEMKDVVLKMRRTWIQWVNRHTRLSIGEGWFEGDASSHTSFKEHVGKMADSINTFGGNQTADLQLMEMLNGAH